MARPITSVTFTIETASAEFSHETNGPDNGVYDDETISRGIVRMLDKYAARIRQYGIEHYDGLPIIGVNGQTVGRIIIEREDKP